MDIAIRGRWHYELRLKIFFLTKIRKILVSFYFPGKIVPFILTSGASG